MKAIYVLFVLGLIVSCSSEKGNPGEDDWMADYERIQAELELKLENAPTVFAEGEPIILEPKLYLSGELIPKNDTLPEDIFSNYEIRYTLNRDLNIDSVYANPDYAYFITGLKDKIILADPLPLGTHFVSINCQLNSDAGFSKQIKQQITVR